MSRPVLPQIGLISILVAVGVLSSGAPARAQGAFGPATAVFITYDNSLSMDYTTTLGEIPAAVSVCEPDLYEYARTRHIVAAEALTGSFQDYCYTQLTRDQTIGIRDDVDGYPVHTFPLFSRQRRDGLLDVYADSLYFGMGTFDAISLPTTGPYGDYSYGTTYSTINLGLANYHAPIGELISPLPPGWLPPTPGALTAFRLNNNRRIQEQILQVVPGRGTPISAALDDLQLFVHRDPGMRSDPFRACRPFAHVLVTDGAPLWDQCASAPGALEDGDTTFPCSTYTSTYQTPEYEASDLANGTGCANCPGGAADLQIPTYVVAFASDDPNSAESIASYGGTCALLDSNGNCIQHAFRAEDQAELIFALGTVFNRFLKGEISMVPPLTSTFALDSNADGEGAIGLARFRAGALVSQTSPYWTGTLQREVYTCQVGQEGEPPVLTQGTTVSFEDQYTQIFADARRIYTARLDIAELGSSCARPNCAIDDHACYDSGAVPNPQNDGSLSGFGDGTGGEDSGGANIGVLDDLSSTVDCSGSDYNACVSDCAVDDDDCVCRCQEWFACGTCGYIGTPPVCDTILESQCLEACLLRLGETSETVTECTCLCEDELDCGTCADGVPLVTQANATSRDVIDQNLEAERELAYIRGNDDPLPAPPSTVDFDALEVDNSCLIPFDRSTFVDTSNLGDYLYAANSVEAARTVEFTRGATLAALGDDGLLSDVFDPATVTLHDRVATGYVGDFYHSQMALLGRPSPQVRDTPGYETFVQQVGTAASSPRPYTLFVGGNDGMLHAFNALTGEEMWAVIPPSFLPQLSQAVISHRIMVDGPVVTRDLRCSQTAESETWCSLLAVSYRGGGSGAMVLDVTDPTHPKFLYEVTARQIPELGLGYPRPLLGNMLIGAEVRPVLVLAGGQPLGGRELVVGNELIGSNEGEVLVVMDAVTGEIYRQFDPVSHPALFAECGPVTGSPSGWSDDQFTRIFAGTQNGCLLRFDTSNEDPLQWTMELLYKTQTGGEITFPPALAPRSDGTLVIVFGHGDLDQFEHINQQSSLVSVNEQRGFLEGDIETGRLATFTLSSASVNWELQLAEGEFLTAAPIVADGVVFAATWAPDANNPCTGGAGRLYGIDYIGDASVNGDDSTMPYVVTIGNDRIVARLDNPNYDPLDPDSPTVLKYYGTDILGQRMVIFGVSIESVPDCDTFSALTLATGEAMATTRRLMVEGLAEQSQTATAGDESGGASEPVQATEAPSMTVINFAHDLPQATITVVPIDWGVVLDF